MKKAWVKRLLLVVVLVFAIMNLNWYIFSYLKYSRFTDGFKYNGYSYQLNRNGYSLEVVKPEYLMYQGFLKVGTPSKDEKDPNNIPAISISPATFTSDSKYQFSTSYDINGTSGIVTFIIDKNGNAKENEIIVEKNKEAIEGLLKQANQTWHLQ